MNTSTEYWQKGASLIHTNPDGTRDLPAPQNARQYLVAGTKHGGRSGATTERGNAFHPNNPHSASPLLRPCRRRRGVGGARRRTARKPRAPSGRRHAGTGEAAIASFPQCPGYLPRFVTPIAPVADWVAGIRGPEEAWRPLVPAVDADGNELGGAAARHRRAARHLHRLEPLCRRGAAGRALRPRGQLPGFRAGCGDAAGERRSAPEPGRALRDTGRLAAAVRAAAEALVAKRLLLAEDVTSFVAQAESLH
ncbi:hypothetical protein ACFQU2_41110 [Siccirubricoccus deserti]